MSGVCPYCKKEVIFKHDIELFEYRFLHFRKTYEIQEWESCPECHRVVSYAKYDMKRDKAIRCIGLTSFKVYRSKEVFREDE